MPPKTCQVKIAPLRRTPNVRRVKSARAHNRATRARRKTDNVKRPR